jgi:hypothetical protein
MNFRKAASEPTCAVCAYFLDDPLELERAFPGTIALSSAYGSTRGRSGICTLRNTFQDPIPACPDYLARSRQRRERPDP